MYQSQTTMDTFKIENLMLKILPSVPRGTKYKIKNILTLKAVLEPALSALCDYSQIEFGNKSMRT